MLTTASHPENRRSQHWEKLLILLVLLGLLCLACSLLSQGWVNAPKVEFIPVDLSSSLVADYSADPNAARVPGVSLGIIWDSILDREPNVPDIEARQAALLAGLQTPVPFVTPSLCQGTHTIYASQDTWIDSANPKATHGNDSLLQLGRTATDRQRLLFSFTFDDQIPPATFIRQAFLELKLDRQHGSARPEVFQFYSLAAPFSESGATWSNHPEALVGYRTTRLVDTNRYVWDVTGIVQNWLLSNDRMLRLMLDPQGSPEFALFFYSREASNQTSRTTSDADRLGPRLIIDCGGALPQPVAAVTTPTFTPTPAGSSRSTPTLPPAQPGSSPTLGSTPAPGTPTGQPPTPPLPLASPTAAAPTTTPSSAPTISAPLPSPTPSSAPATSAPRPTPTPSSSGKDNNPDPTPTNTSNPPSKPVLPSLSINNVTVTESDTGTVIANFTVSLSAATSQIVAVNFTTANGSATAPADYTAANGALIFAPGTTVQTLSITVQGDTLDEINETFFVNLSNPTNATLNLSQGQGTIIDNDSTPSLTINDVTVTEGNSGTVSAIFTVSLSAASGQMVQVNYTSANVSATTPDDYLAASGVLTFNPGTTSQTIAVTVNGDLTIEPNETFAVNLSNASNASIADNQGLGTILNDDGVTLSIADVTVTEGDTGTVNAVFMVTLSTTSTQTIQVDYATANGTAFAGSDYTAIPATTLTFNPGVTTQPIAVSVLGDTIDEVNETFFVNLSNAVNATILDSQGLGTIVDDDAPPTLAINDITVTEGDAGAVTATLTVSLSEPSGLNVTVNYASANNTATAGSDYVAIPLTPLTFAAGDTIQTIIVTVQGDTLYEIDETFFVNLTSPTDAAISDGQGTVTILNDDAVAPCSSPVITLTATADTFLASNMPNSNSGSDPELQTQPPSNSTHSLIQFSPGPTLSNSLVTCAALLLTQISNPETNQIVEIHRVTNSWAENQATWNNRLTGTPWNTPGGDSDPAVAATFTPNATNHAINITALTQFWADNPAANFGLLLLAQDFGSNNGVRYASRENGSNPLPQLVIDYMPTLAINDVTLTEGDSGTATADFNVTLSASAGQTVTVDFATADNTATAADNDYVPTSGTLIFAPGVTVQPVSITVNGDTNPEPTENFFVNLSNPANAGITDGQGVGTILQDVGGLNQPAPRQIFLPLLLKEGRDMPGG